MERYGCRELFKQATQCMIKIISLRLRTETKQLNLIDGLRLYFTFVQSNIDGRFHLSLNANIVLPTLIVISCIPFVVLLVYFSVLHE